MLGNLSINAISEERIGENLSGIQTKRDLIELLQEFIDVFAWLYQDMSGLSTDIVVHRPPIKEECKPVQQKLRMMRLDVLLKIKEEVKKQFNAGFLQVVKYSEWVANIVPVPKKDEKVRICVDYRDLNKASLKDNFLLPHIDTLVDNMTGVWDEKCQKTFDKVKHYLSNALVLMPPSQEKSLILYLAVFGNFIGCVLGQHDELGRKERAIYYLIKGSAIVDFLASRALEDYEPLNFDFPNEDLMYVATTKEDAQEGYPWKLNFDGASNTMGNGIEAILNDKRTLRRLANDYVLDGEILYKRRKDQVLLRCVDPVEAKKILEEVHEGVCGTHTNDVIEPISPKAFNGHCFIFVVIDYFTKWVEIASYANVTNTISEVCSQFKIKHHNSSPYRPKMNGAMEAANKNIKKIEGKMTETYKDWHKKLPFALYAYRTSVRTTTGATAFFLVYEMETIFPIEAEIPSLHVLSELKLDEAEWIQSRYDQLNLIEKKRLKAIRNGQMYQKRMIRVYDKKVCPRGFYKGDLVLKKILPIQKDFRGKWMPNWERPYVVKKVFPGGALILTEMDGKNLSNPVNLDSVKKYFYLKKKGEAKAKTRNWYLETKGVLS
ncbi:RNA-directed DNA polymerase (Reverse transcriptase), Ribonuclease H [Gossypium australe]|uniref:RNA-directed DNA polymerase (Reverse transcriptase), Ribonuclease H n=1 Tax=Gossypium australe TaxID=47621 RepID=A0A5B6WZR8_9ROSI|nr:RNA-directed DNA polymerase (Reverse transcriptase), Ribonuclease H [Gossypium australe]